MTENQSKLIETYIRSKVKKILKEKKSKLNEAIDPRNVAKLIAKNCKDYIEGQLSKERFIMELKSKLKILETL